MRVLLAIAVSSLLGAGALDDDIMSLLQHRGKHPRSAQCEPPDASYGPCIGHGVTEREHQGLGHGYIEYVDTGWVLPEPGKLDKVRFFVKRDNQGNNGLRFGIYRQDGPANWKKIAMTEPIDAPNFWDEPIGAGRVFEYTFLEKVPFLFGDRIGWTTTGGNPMTWELGGRRVVTVGGLRPNCGIIPGGNGRDETYSYEIYTAPVSASDYDDAEMCGAPIPEGLPQGDVAGESDEAIPEGLPQGDVAAEADEAAAGGDPHITTNIGAHFDLTKGKQ